MAPRTVYGIGANGELTITTAKASKYKNEPNTLVDPKGDVLSFDSKAERRRYCELELLERAGEIRNLQRQVRFELIPKQGKERAAHYVADFVYDESTPTGWVQIVEDVKGKRTPQYVLKRKLMLHRHGIQVRETK